MKSSGVYPAGVDVTTSAKISDCKKYRYILTRVWDASLPPLVVVGLNPSTADETRDDATIRRCVSFARREGMGQLWMMNLFAYRATKPSDMKAAEDPIGPENDIELSFVLSKLKHDPRGKIVFAWGNHGYYDRRDEQVISLVEKVLGAGIALTFGMTGVKQPKHPLFLAADAELVPFVPFSAAV